MNDLISRQAAINELSTPRGILYPIRTIESMPSAQPQDIARGIATIIENEKDMRVMLQQRWIPVTERLPENGRQVLIYATNVHYALAKYDEMRDADGTYKKQWVTFDAWKPFYTIKNVLAWRELPEHYAERRRDDVR